ncbi:MAG: Rieske 2Fe-2S domain-containing protein [Deltaproteobacteria bacterium]|nr:Rieske 2Fe-2S domain-containing protein [Deltaproteobacteria bacterium]
MSWREIAIASDIEEGQAVVCKDKNETIALFKYQGNFYAIQDRCPHRGASLAEGEIENGCVICPWHAWQFELKSGQSIEGYAPLKTFQIKVEKNKVWIKSD